MARLLEALPFLAAPLEPVIGTFDSRFPRPVEVDVAAPVRTTLLVNLPAALVFMVGIFQAKMVRATAEPLFVKHHLGMEGIQEQ